MSNTATLLIKARRRFPCPSLHASTLRLLFFFIIENESVCLGCFPTTILTVDGESQSSFAMSAHFRFGSLFLPVAKYQASRLSTMGFTSSQSWFLAVQNDKPAGAPKKRGMTQMGQSRREHGAWNTFDWRVHQAFFFCPIKMQNGEVTNGNAVDHCDPDVESRAETGCHRRLLHAPVLSGPISHYFTIFCFLIK